MRALVRCSAIALVIAVTSCTNQPPLVARCNRFSSGGRAGQPALVGLEYGEQASPIPLNSIQFSNWDAARSLSVQRLAASRTPTNTVEVAARFVSCSDIPFAVRVRTSFLDANQAPTEAASAWQTVYLQPHLTATYSERSISTGAKNYLLEVMPQ
jgi:hypothetical protein